MEDFFIILLVIMFVVALFAGAGIYGIITVVGVVVFIIALIYIINN